MLNFDGGVEAVKLILKLQMPSISFQGDINIVPRRYFCCGSSCFVFWSRIFVLFEPYVRFHIFSSVRVTEWPPIGE